MEPAHRLRIPQQPTSSLQCQGPFHKEVLFKKQTKKAKKFLRPCGNPEDPHPNDNTTTLEESLAPPST